MSQESGIGKRLVVERERLGFTQEEFGVLGGYDTLEQIAFETGDQSPPMDYLNNLSKVGLDILFIITGEPSFGTLDVYEQYFADQLQHLSEDKKSRLLEILN